MEDTEVKLIPDEALVSMSNMEEVIPTNILEIGAQTKWKRGFSGQEVVIAVIDTGCDSSHPDLSEAIIDGYNFTTEHYGNPENYNDTNGHGTHAAGVIAAAQNNKGVIGISFKSKLLILKVLNSVGGGSIDNLIKSLDYASNWRGPNNERVRIISLSLGTKQSSTELHNAVKRAINNGISVVVASGNDGDGEFSTNEYRYPGAYEEVIEVGAIDQNQKIAHFSNTNEYVDLYAPGVNVYSTFLNQQYAILSGTSMAVPHVAGALGLLIEEHEYKQNKRLSEQEIYDILMLHTENRELNNYNINILSLSKKPFKRKEEIR
ncbi:S8 family peptidase [Rummeliibacillus sp. BSL5]